MRLELINAKKGHYGEIWYSDVSQNYCYQVHAGRMGYTGYKAGWMTDSMERGFTKTLKGAKSAVSQLLGYKSEWTEVSE